MVDELKKCIGCKIEKPLTDFRKRDRNGNICYEGGCKKCTYELNKANITEEHREKERQRYQENKDEINAARRAKAAANRVPKVKKPKQSKEEKLKKTLEWQKIPRYS